MDLSSMTERVRTAPPDGPLEPLGRLLEHLDVRHREVTPLLRTGDVAALRCRTTAERPAGGELTWHETHVVHVSGGVVRAEHPAVPLTTLRTFLAGDTRRWQPPRRQTSRAATALVAATARLARAHRDLSPIQVVDRYVQEFKNGRRFAAFPELFGTGFRHHFDFPARDDRLPTFVDVGRCVLGAFGDLRVHVDDLVADGPVVLERNHVVARHVGSFTGERPTGREVTWSETHLYRVSGGRIVENWPAVDWETLAATLGDSG